MAFIVRGYISNCTPLRENRCSPCGLDLCSPRPLTRCGLKKATKGQDARHSTDHHHLSRRSGYVHRGGTRFGASRKDSSSPRRLHDRTDSCSEPRILSETILLSTTNERDHKLTVRIVPIIPSLSGRHFAASPCSLVSLCDGAAIPTSKLRESYGVTEEDAARACIRKVEHFLRSKDRIRPRVRSPAFNAAC
jgi:hypothetical protein